MNTPKVSMLAAGLAAAFLVGSNNTSTAEANPCDAKACTSRHDTVAPNVSTALPGTVVPSPANPTPGD